MNRTILHGPQGSGKTGIAVAYARMQKRVVIVDEWDGIAKLPPHCLAITCVEPPFKGLAPSDEIISIDMAKALLPDTTPRSCL